MAKLTKASDYIIEFIEDIIAKETTLEHLITWRILSIEKQKEMIKVTKANATTEYLAKCPDCVIFYVNEEIFYALEPKMANDVDYRKILVSDVLASIDIQENEQTGNMKINIIKPQICVTMDGYAKYGENLINGAASAFAAYTMIEEEKKRKKEAEKAAKRKKKEDNND